MDKEMRTLERLIGPAAYRGAHRRSLGGRNRKLRAGVQKDRQPVMDTRPDSKGIPTHSNPTEGGGPRLPSARPQQVDRKQDDARMKRAPKKRRKDDDFQDFS
jgi:hypothetical protein